ncbi:MAG: OmpH family outer membrane protein [Rhodothermia bacterium]
MFGTASLVSAQQKIGYVDTEFILRQVPEYATVQQNLDRLAAEWQTELTRMQREIDAAFQEYQSRELLYTADERQTKQADIITQEEALEQFRVRNFGPEGELFKRQEGMMRPIQERILEAVEDVATSGGYDYVLDKSSSTIFLFYRDQYDLSINVLKKMGIDTDNIQATSRN